MSARDLLAPAFPDDTGEADPAVRAALDAWHADPARRPEAVAALQGTRVLVPVVAVLGEVEVDARGLAHDKSADMAAVLMRGRDGRVALLGFTSLAAMAAWDPEARPVPVAAETAALAAVQEGAQALVLDLAGPVRFVLEGEDLRAFAAGWRLARVGDDVVWLGPAVPDSPPVG
ncbi:SseB family protein [Nocardioides sp.]|uniref:SseB family protein n=1 Tax=Nocardioides sp. TaxID=35761 RepID=UPI003511582A